MAVERPSRLYDELSVRSYLYVGSTTYIFGSTVYPTHVPTTDWTVHFNDMSHHLGVAGIGFRF